MDFFQSSRPKSGKNVLSTRRKIKVLSALNSGSRKCLYDNINESRNDTISDHGREVMNLLQSELSFIECLKQLKNCMVHPMVKEVIEHLDDIISLIDEMLSMHGSLCSVLLHGKSELSDALKQLSSNLDVYVSYSILISLELSNIQKFSEMYYCNTNVQITDLLHEPMAHISRCKTLFQNLFSTQAGEIYGEILQAVEYTCGKIKNTSFLQKNALRILQIQKLLVRRQPKILSPGRTVIKEGILYKVNCHGSGLKQRAFFLFSDFLLCCKILSKAFEWQEKDSLLCSALFSLSSCSVNFVMGSSSSNRALFKVTCGNASCLLLSQIPGESQNWVQELQAAIRACQKPASELKPKLKRTKNICIKTSTSPFLKRLKSSESVSIVEQNTEVERMNSPEPHSRPSSLGKLKKLLTCIKP